MEAENIIIKKPILTIDECCALLHLYGGLGKSAKNLKNASFAKDISHAELSKGIGTFLQVMNHVVNTYLEYQQIRPKIIHEDDELNGN